MEQIRCSNLSIGYGERAIASGLSFSVNAGDYLCIVGENGAGKSTLMRTLLGLQKPVSGHPVYSPEIRKNEIGYLPQQLHIQRDFPATAGEIVLSGFQGQTGRRPFYRRSEKAEARAIMRRLCIGELAGRSFRSLSGGQQQKVLLARALCASGKILFMDEPVTGLDPEATREMYAIIGELNRRGMTIVMISHDILSAVRYADHILHIGSTCFFGRKEDYLRSETGKRFLNRREVGL
ncbi:ABC transporter [Hornefia porci]|uniref:ABC transporter n=1 Tax=Hornefia porci TaxID=2652292 RepID=A0A1Q9JGK5_9FIRM|nr:metal ABC transporter ATP-binding protein [Hornefia porci]OLR55241.1 ABC transporter [Hornefia porci]